MVRGYSDQFNAGFTRRRLVKAAVLLVTLAVVGCERSAQTSAPPATQQSEAPQAPVDVVDSAATKASAVQSPATVPSNAVMLVDQRRQEFPPARVVLHNKNGKVTALLYSDDPKDAIKDDYTGNGFYIQMPLDIDEPAEIDGAVWHFTSTSSEREDSPYGIFLRGSRQRLQPQNVTVQFDGPANDMILWISGVWMLFDDTDENAPPKLVPVTARLKPTVTVKPPKP